MELLRECLFWLDAAAWRHWTLTGLLLGATGLLALLPGLPQTPAQALRPWWFVLVVGLTLCAFRWPTWFYRQALNPDEAQIVAGALTLARFPLPWKYLDPTTHGPLCEYFLIFASWFGAPFNYVTARIVAALLQAGALLAVWATLRKLIDESSARLAILPGLAFWCFTSWDDFLHYSSELPGIFLMAWGGYFLVRAVLAPAASGSDFNALLAGFSLGLVPYAKLQSTPHAVLIGLIGMALAWRLTPENSTRRRRLIALLGGALAPTALHGVYLTAFGLWGQFWYSYLVSAIDYLANSELRLADMPARFLHFSATSPSFAWFLWGGLGFALLYQRSPRPNRALRLAIGLGWLLLLAAWFSVLRPGREVVHYLHLLVIPLTMLAGLVLGNALATGDATERVDGGSRWRVLGAFGLLCLAPQALNHFVAYHRFVGHARTHGAEPPSPVATFLNARTQSGDTLALWGWHSHLLVETQLPHGTREAHSASQIIRWPLTRFYVDRYLGDLEKRRPEWFVDAVGPGAFVFADRGQHAHESVPALRDWIAANYEFDAEIESMRIYRLKGAGHPQR